MTLRIAPQPDFFIPGTSSRMYQNDAVRLTSRVSFHSSSVIRVIAVTRRDGCVVDEHVDGPEMLFGTTAKRPDLVEGRLVHADADRAPGDLVGDTFGIGLLPAVHDHCGALGGEELGDRAPDAARRTGHEGDASIECSDRHVTIFRSGARNAGGQPERTSACGCAKRRLATMVGSTSRWRSEFRVGDRHVLGIADGTFTMADDFMTSRGSSGSSKTSTATPSSRSARSSCRGLSSLLIDAGVGPFAIDGLSGGALLHELAAIGVQPTDVDVIAVSHLHLDHDGWLETKHGGVTFPNVVVHLGRADYEFFVLRDGSDESPDRARREKAALAERFDAGRVVLVDDATGAGARCRRRSRRPAILPATWRSPSVITVSSSSVLGDAMYCPAQLTDADLTACTTSTPCFRERSRELIQREVESHATSAVSCHFPGLRAARVVGRAAVA